MKYVLAIFLISNLLAQENQTRFDSLVYQGVHQIYNLKFEDAEQTFEKVQSEFPGNPAGSFFDAMIIWWRIMIDFNNTELDDLFVEKLENVIDKCDDILDEDPNNIDALFFKGGALGFRGKLYSIRESWFDAALDGKDALPIVYDAYAVDSTNMDIQLGFGIYNYYAEMIPEKYPFVKPFMIFFPSGDKKKGIEQLEAAAMEGKYSKYESRYFLMTLFYQHENNFSKALEYAEMLTGDFPDNPIFQRHHGRILVRMGFYRRATRIFSDILKKCEAKLRGYSESSKREATYYMGLNLFKDNRPDSSKVYFKESEKLSRMLIGKEYKQTGYLANTLLYLGMIEDLSGNRENAIEYYEQVLDLDDFKDSHNRAEKYIETPYKK
ncbi:MAG: hypothetical protein PVH88_27915 [Ignavibacteria bacterium]|jgi:tetratricopeptide (TPR) repeat protein